MPARPAAGQADAAPGGVDAILDAWEADGEAIPSAVFSRLVRQAYDEGFEHVTVGFDEKASLYNAYAYHYEESRLIQSGNVRVGERIIALFGERGRVHDVAHGGLVIPFEVEFSGPHRMTGILRRSKRMPPPPIEDYGIEGQARWVACVASSPGLHLMCRPAGFDSYLRRGYGRLEETLPLAFAGHGIGVESRIADRSALRLCTDEDGIPQDTPRVIFLLGKRFASGDIVREIVDSGSSVILMAPGTIDQALARLLADGYPVEWLRRNLLSTAFRTDAPEPHLPANKLGVDDCSGMRWETEVRKPAA